MGKLKNNPRVAYAAVFLAIFATEVLIALFVKDRFIRPYVGDVLVTVLICSFLRIFVPRGAKLLPVWVFLFAVAVEVGQYFGIVDILGLGHITFFRVLIGTSFSWVDIVCYGVGCAIFATADAILKKPIKK